MDYAVAFFGLNGLTALTNADFGERLYEMAKILTTVTRQFAKYTEVIDDTLEWGELVRTMVAHRDGTSVVNPLYAPRSRHGITGMGLPVVVP